MFFSKLLFYSSIVLMGLGASTGVTVLITHTIDENNMKNAANNAVVEEGDVTTPSDIDPEETEIDPILPKASDSKLFMMNLQNFGNLDGYVDATINYKDNKINVLGDVFVSLESLDNLALYANLNIGVNNYYVNVEATYINNTVYLSLLDLDLKLNTNDINEVTSIFNDVEMNIELPENFANIDMIEILTNLNNMEAIKGDKAIVYTAYLLDGFPPLYFQSDFDHHLTNVKITDAKINDDLSFSLEAHTTVLGAGQNKVVVPESEARVFTDVSHYFGIADQIKGIARDQKIDVNYDIKAYKGEEELVATKGNANVDFSSNLALRINGEVSKSYNDELLTSNYVIDYSNNIASINYNDVVKAKFEPSISNIDTLTSSISNLLGIDVNALMPSLNDIKIPLIDMINAKDYIAIARKYDSAILKDDAITLNISNSLFSNNDSLISLVLSIDDHRGIKNININNFAYEDYHLDISLDVNEYQEVTPLDNSNYLLLEKVSPILNQIKDIIDHKALGLDLDVTYGDINVNGYAQAKLNDDLSINNIDADINAHIENNDIHLLLERNNETTYISYNGEINTYVANNSLTDIIDILIKNYTSTPSILKDYIGELSFAIYLPEINLKTLFDLPLSKFEFVDNTLSISLTKEFLDLEDDINLSIALNTEDKISGINFSTTILEKELNASLAIKNYDENYHAINKNVGTWIGASDIKEAINYIDNLGYEVQNAVIDQIKGYVNDINNNSLELGVDYVINVDRDDVNVFTMNGDIDFKLDNDNIEAHLVSDMNNSERGLDSSIDIAYQDEAIYFNYNDELKLSYAKTSIEDLINIIKTRLPSNDGLSGALDMLLPDASTASSPLFTIINEGNYLSLFDYYKSIYYQGNVVSIVLDAAILGDTTGELIISIDITNNGLTNIKINNLYAFGYHLDFDFTIRNYQNFEIKNKETYTSLNYVTNIFDGILDLVDDNKYALNLSGSIKTNNGTISLNGSTQFSITDTIDRGIGKLTLTDTSNKEHNVIIDVSKKHAGEDASREERVDALRKSEVLFSYNSNLKGKFNLSSLEDTYNYIVELATSGNKRLEKYKTLLTRDFSNSIFNQILNGHIEEVLYQNMLNNITYSDNKYTIEINGAFLKENTDIDVSNIYIDIKLDNLHHLSGIALRGKVLEYDININLDFTTYSESYTGLNPNDTYYDFSDMGTMVKYLLNTAQQNDFTLSGNVSVKLLNIINFADCKLSAKVHIEEDEMGEEKVYVRAEISNIPCGFLYLSNNRKFTMYFTDDMVYLRTEEGKNISYVRLTMSEFFDKPVYYLVNYGFGISTSLIDGNDIKTEDKDIKLENLISNYKYSLSSLDPKWDITLNMEELSGSSALGDLSVTILGNHNNELLKDLTAYMNVASILDVNLNASLTSVAYIGDSEVNSIKSYIVSHQNDVLGKEY